MKMAKFSPIDPALYRKIPDGPAGSIYRNIGQHSIDYFESLDSIYQPDEFANSWGYTIFRTDYSLLNADENFAKAVKLLNTYAGNWLFDDLIQPYRRPGDPPLDPRVMYEVRRRFVNVVVEDQAALEGSTLEEVGCYFDAWIEEHEDDLGSRDDPRLRHCIMLDKESVDNLLTMPEDPNHIKLPDHYYIWVKLVTSEVRDGRRLWLR